MDNDDKVFLIGLGMLLGAMLLTLVLAVIAGIYT